MELCDDNEIASLVKAMQNAETGDLAELERALALYPQDARLHFMRGSVLAERKDAREAHAALSRAVELAPDFDLARYQLGFFELTSGEVDQALSSWGPLMRLPEDAYLRKFVEALTCMIRDEFEDALERMREGIALNGENEPLNNDIRLLMQECERLIDTGVAARNGSSDKSDVDQSATSVLLGQFTRDPTRR